MHRNYESDSKLSKAKLVLKPVYRGAPFRRVVHPGAPVTHSVDIAGDYAFDSKPVKTRGVPVGFRKPVYRDATVSLQKQIFRGALVNHVDTVKDEGFLTLKTDSTDDLPTMPYPWQVCSSNTFTCTNYSKSPRDLQDQLKEIIRRSPADVSPTSDWQFKAVFYPKEVKTAFTVSLFADDSDQKNAFLVEMHLTEGDRVAFQNLVSYARSKANLKYAFADKLGFLDEDDDDEEVDRWDAGAPYEHTSFGPLPLPKSLLLKMQADETPDDGTNSLVEMFLENASSCYADVRRTGWQELANCSKEVDFAKALVTARVNDKDCITIAIEELKTEVTTCSLITDTRRCVIKTLLNIAAKAENVEACARMCVLKPEILAIASGKIENINSTEIQCSAVQLMQHLIAHHLSHEKEFVAALKYRATGSCRVSNCAQEALRCVHVT